MNDTSDNTVLIEIKQLLERTVELLENQAATRTADPNIPAGNWNCQQVAEWLGVSVTTIKHRACGTKAIPTMRIGDRVLYAPADVVEWREKKRAEAREYNKKLRQVS